MVDFVMPVEGPHSWPGTPSGLFDMSLYPVSSYPVELQSALVSTALPSTNSKVGRKRKRLSGGDSGVQLAHTATYAPKDLGGYESRPLRLATRITHAALYDNWLLVATVDGLIATRFATDIEGNHDKAAIYQWKPETVDGRIWEIAGGPQAFRTTKDCFEVIVSYQGRPRHQNLDLVDPSATTSFHVVFEPVPRVLNTMPRSSYPLAFNGKWICFEKQDGIRYVHVYRAQDGLVVPLAVDDLYGRIGAYFARRAQTLVAFSTVTEDLQIFSTEKFANHFLDGSGPLECQQIRKIGWIPANVKICHDAALAPVLLDRTGNHLALFSQANSVPNRFAIENSSPAMWAKTLIETGYYIGDAVFLPGGMHLAYVVHHRLGKYPSRVEIVPLPPFPSVEGLTVDAPVCKSSGTVYKSGSNEKNAILHCDALVVEPSPERDTITFLVGQRGTPSWFYIRCGQAPGIERVATTRAIPLEEQNHESGLDLVGLIEAENIDGVRRIMSSVRKRLASQHNWGFTVGQTALPNSEFWDDWNTGQDVELVLPELLEWPRGGMVVLRKYFGIDLQVDLVAGRSEETVNDFVFATTVKGEVLYLALNVNLEHSERASDQFRLRRSFKSAVDAASQLARKSDLRIDTPPDPDSVHRHRAIWRDIESLSDITSVTKRARVIAIAKRMQGLVCEADRD